MSNHGIGSKQKRSYIEQLWEIQRGRCYYCKDLILPMRFVKEYIVEFNSPYGTVRYLDAGIMILTKYATLDHILARALNGTNTLENLRLACADCNGDRGMASND